MWKAPDRPGKAKKHRCTEKRRKLWWVEKLIASLTKLLQLIEKFCLLWIEISKLLRKFAGNCSSVSAVSGIFYIEYWREASFKAWRKEPVGFVCFFRLIQRNRYFRWFMGFSAGSDIAVYVWLSDDWWTVVQWFKVLYDCAAPWLWVWWIYTIHVMTILKIFLTDFADFVIIPDVKVCEGYNGPGTIVRGKAEDIEP